MRVWGRRQTLHVGWCPELEPDLSGLAFSPNGRRLYVGTEEGLATYAIDSAARRSFAHSELC